MSPFLLLAQSGNIRENLSILHPVSPAGEAIRELLYFVAAVCAFIFLIVELVLLYSMIRFRGGGREGREPPQVYGSLPIEIAWTAGPTLVVFLLVLVIVRTEYEVRINPNLPPAGSKPLHVTVIGRQWWWEYVYQRYDARPLGFVTANELHVPASEDGTPRPVYLTLRSDDVCHSFWVPRLAGKTDLIPGRTNTMWFQTDRQGLYLGQCAEFCGTQHANMLLRVYVEPEADFLKWAENQAQPAVDDPAVRKGKDLFLGQSCINCHRVRGTIAQGSYAPDLTHLASRETLASGMRPLNRETLLAWVTDPQKIKAGCLMPAFGLSPAENQLVVDYLLSLK